MGWKPIVCSAHTYGTVRMIRLAKSPHSGSQFPIKNDDYHHLVTSQKFLHRELPEKHDVSPFISSQRRTY